VASLVSVELEYGVRKFHCPTCGQCLLSEEEGLKEPFCNHLVAVIDWVDELVLNEALNEHLASSVQTAFDKAADGDGTQSVAAILPATVVGFALSEAARGAGHSGDAITLFVDIQGEGLPDE
jgi:endogenous inhibitor of DNA gyrase (YacG/DUF329 family)